MLEECAELSTGLRLSKAAQILEDDPRWKVSYSFLLPACPVHPAAVYAPVQEEDAWGIDMARGWETPAHGCTMELPI